MLGKKYKLLSGLNKIVKTLNKLCLYSITCGRVV